MNEQTPIKSNDAVERTVSSPSSSRSSPRRSPLTSPRSSPRSYAIKRAQIGKTQQARRLQLKLKAEQKETEILNDTRLEGDSTIIEGSNHELSSSQNEGAVANILLPPRVSPRSPPQGSNPSNNRQEELFNIPSDETEENRTTFNQIADAFECSFPSSVMRPIINSDNDNHTQTNNKNDYNKQPQCTANNLTKTQSKKEFSDVFKGDTKSVHLNDPMRGSLEGRFSILASKDDSYKDDDVPDDEKSSDDIFGVHVDRKCLGSVDEVEAKTLFPLPSIDDTIMVKPIIEHKPMSQLDCPMTQLEPAWDEKSGSIVHTILEQAKTRNTKTRPGEDGDPLLELNAISSDNDSQIAAERLLSQKERITLYTSGKGFGVGEDSSVEIEESDSEVDDINDKLVEYEAVHDKNDDADVICSQQNIDTYECIEFGESSHEQFSAAGSIAVQAIDSVLTRSGDAMPDNCKMSDFVNNADGSSNEGGTVSGLRIVRSNDKSSGSSSPASCKEYVISLKSAQEETVSENTKLFKIAPPPPEKLQKWEESKSRSSGLKPPIAAGSKSAQLNRELSSPKRKVHPLIPKNTPPSSEQEITSNLKINTPKSPTRKLSHSVTEELNLSSQTKMAEKIVIASVNAAKKFEEKYSYIEHDVHYGHQSKSPHRKGENSKGINQNRFFCAGETAIPFIPIRQTNNSDNGQPLQHHNTTAELVGGAFSPWRIPDRTEEDSNASSSRIIYDDESYAKASAAALRSIRHDPELMSSIPSDGKEPKSSESVEVCFDLKKGNVSSGAKVNEEHLLSGVLEWLFDEVLPSNAERAFEMNTTISVQAKRVLAIAHDDASLNLICRHVTEMLIKGGMNSSLQKKNESVGITNSSSSGDLSSSSCEYSQATSTSISERKSTFSERAAARILKRKKRLIEPFCIPMSPDEDDVRFSSEMLAANFISFLQQISNLTGVACPFDENPFLQSVVNLTPNEYKNSKGGRSMQDLVFDTEENVVNIFIFLKKVCLSGKSQKKELLTSIVETADDSSKNVAIRSYRSPFEWVHGPTEDSLVLKTRLASGSRTVKRSNKRKPLATKGSPIKESSLRQPNLNLVVPKTNPSPFETAVWNDPSIMLSILSFLGNPVSVCVVKRLNVFCNRLVCENEHVLMRDAVRLGGMSKYIRPSFWIWVIMERCVAEDPIPLSTLRGYEQSFSIDSDHKNGSSDFVALKDKGARGKWQHIVERDVLRAFGNMPPHKTGAKYRQDSIVRALVSFGKEEIMRNSRSYQAMDKLPEESARHFKLSSRLDPYTDGESDDISETPTDTVSDWGGITPVGSMVSEEPSASASDDGLVTTEKVADVIEVKRKLSLKLNSSNTSKSDVCDPVLSGNALTNEMKIDLQNKLRSILHALTAQHEGLGYCQGMDYVVAHLLRVLQDTILLRVVKGSMPILETMHTNNYISPSANEWKTMSAEQLRFTMNTVNSDTMVVDEVVFRIMDTLFTTYNLQHMYWPELRCLKTCCRVFEKLIRKKLPVLADHFEHHDLNVGLFALGWFQTLFLYLPSMPSATVCHMWDIWLVERSFKIFFRVGTAILFLSQPTLLNHDLEGMMTYLNTFPDATLLRRDILIPCALQIKVTNSMLVEIEMDVTNYGKSNETGGEQYSVY